MSLKKRECQRPNIRTRDCGQAEWMTGMFLVTILIIVLYMQLQIVSWQASSMYLEDALAASNLASALVNVEKYGRTRAAVIDDPQTAYQIYQNAVRENLQLDEHWMCMNENLISGQVEIVDYVIYNVEQNRVSAVRIGSDGTVVERRSGTKGSISAPNGLPIVRTGVYSEIRFPVRGFLGTDIMAHKSKLVDIESEEGD